MGSEKIKTELLHSKILGREGGQKEKKELFKARKEGSMQERMIYWGTKHSFKNK